MSVKKLDGFIFGLVLFYAFASMISIAASNMAVSLALLLSIVRHVKEPFRFRFDKKLAAVIVFFWATVLLSALTAYEHNIAFSKLWAYIYRTLPMLLVAAVVSDKEKTDKIILALAASACVDSLYGIWQAMQGSRADGFSNYMVISGCIIQTLPLFALPLLEGKPLDRRRRLFLAVTVVLSLAALIFSQTRGAWLGALAAAGLYILLSLRFNRKAVLSLCLALAVTAGGFWLSPALQHRVASISDVSLSGENAQRLILWHDSWHIFIDHPWLGVGPGNFNEIRQTRYFSPLATEKLGHAHNNFLHIMAENGAIGLLGFVVMYGYILYSFFRSGVKQRRLVALAAFLGTVAFLTQGLTEFNYGDSAVIRQYWFIVALAMADSFERA